MKFRKNNSDEEDLDISDWFPELPEGSLIEVELRTMSASADEGQIRQALRDVELEVPLRTSHAEAFEGSSLDLHILIGTALFFRDRWANQALDKLKDVVKKAYAAMKDSSNREVVVDVVDKKVSLFVEEDLPDEALQALVEGRIENKSLPGREWMVWSERRNAWVPGRPEPKKIAFPDAF
jgi:hypothetical protein